MARASVGLLLLPISHIGELSCLFDDEHTNRLGGSAASEILTEGLEGSKNNLKAGIGHLAVGEPFQEEPEGQNVAFGFDSSLFRFNELVLAYVELARGGRLLLVSGKLVVMMMTMMMMTAAAMVVSQQARQ